MRRGPRLIALSKRWSSSPRVEQVWNENYHARVAALEAARPVPEEGLQRARAFASYYWQHMKHGLIDTWKDGKTYLAQRGDSLTPAQQLRRASTRQELLKFLPYSFFVLVPFAELLLPFYLWLLPNSTPKYFRTPGNLGRGEEAERAAQARAHATLRAHLSKHLDQAGLRQGQSASAGDRQLAAHLVENWPRYKETLGPAGFDLELTQAALHFLRVPHISGVHIVNQLLNLHVLLINAFYWAMRLPQRLDKARHEFAFWPLAEWRTALLRWQFERHMARLRREDEKFSAEPAQSLAQLDFLESWRFMAERGIFSPSRQNAERQYEQLWLAQPGEDPYLRLWLQVLRKEHGAEAIKA